MLTSSLLLLTLSSPLSEAQQPLFSLLTGGYGSSGQLSSVECLGSPPCSQPSLPSPRKRHLTAVTADGQVLTCGGRGADNEYSLDCLVLEPSLQAWLPHSELPHHREYSTAVTLPSGLYILGGAGLAKYTSTFLALGSSSWQEGPAAPGEGLEDACSVALGPNSFLVIGGFLSLRQVAINHLFQRLSVLLMKDNK